MLVGARFARSCLRFVGWLNGRGVLYIRDQFSPLCLGSAPAVSRIFSQTVASSPCAMALSACFTVVMMYSCGKRTESRVKKTSLMALCVPPSRRPFCGRRNWSNVAVPNIRFHRIPTHLQ